MLAAAATGVAAAGIYAGVVRPIRILLAVPLVLVLPGYAAMAALFPAANAAQPEGNGFDMPKRGLRKPLPTDYELTGVERTALTVASSLILVPGVALVVNFSPWPIRTEPVLAGVTVTTLGFLVIAFLRRAALPAERRFSVSIRALVGRALGMRSRPSPLAADSGLSTLLNVCLAVSVLVVAVTAGFAIANPPRSDTFTEFYVVTEDFAGGDDVYQSSVPQGQSQTLTVAVENHERRTVEYTVVAVLEQGGSSEVVDTQTLTVRNRRTSRASFDVTPTETGDARLVFLLYRGSPPAEPSASSAYRVLDLEWRVTSSGASLDSPKLAVNPREPN